MSKKVTFWVGVGYVGCTKREAFTLEELGIDESEHENEKELEDSIRDAFEDWLWNNVDSGWEFEN